MNGVLATPIIILMVMMAKNPAIMGGLKAPRWMIFISGFTALVMGLSTIGMFVF